MTTNTERRVSQMEDFGRLEVKVDLIQDEVRDLSSRIAPDHVAQADYVRKVMEREARKETLHRAIIEKTVVALIWSALVGIGSLVYKSFSHHWH